MLKWLTVHGPRRRYKYSQPLVHSNHSSMHLTSNFNTLLNLYMLQQLLQFYEWNSTVRFGCSLARISLRAIIVLQALLKWLAWFISGSKCGSNERLQFLASCKYCISACHRLCFDFFFYPAIVRSWSWAGMICIRCTSMLLPNFESDILASCKYCISACH